MRAPGVPWAERSSSERRSRSMRSSGRSIRSNKSSKVSRRRLFHQIAFEVRQRLMSPPRLGAADLTRNVYGRPKTPLHVCWNYLKRKTTDCLAWFLFGPDPLRTVIDLRLERDPAGDLDEDSPDEAAEQEGQPTPSVILRKSHRSGVRGPQSVSPESNDVSALIH
jgi:hypothetical protein